MGWFGRNSGDGGYAKEQERRAKATATWRAGTPARSAGHWRNLKKNADKGQAWEDSQR